MRRTGMFLVAAALGAGALVAVWSMVGSEPQRSPETEAPVASTSPTPTRPVGRDIGLGFRVCRVSKLEGPDLLGDGTVGTVWTATTVTSEGKCNRSFDDAYLVAVDATGDGRADASWSALRYCFVCEPRSAVDFDADGSDEIVVLEQGGSVGSFMVFSVTRRSDGSIRVEPIRIAAPGNPEGKLRPGRILRFWVGGDEGFSAAIGCEGYPADPVLIVAWSNHPIDGRGSETTEVHVSRLRLTEGTFEVVGASNTNEPTGYYGPESFPEGSETCGLKLEL